MPKTMNLQKRWACILADRVEKVIIWDGVSDWAPAKNYLMIELEDASPVGTGWDYVDGKFVDNRPVFMEGEEL